MLRSLLAPTTRITSTQHRYQLYTAAMNYLRPFQTTPPLNMQQTPPTTPIKPPNVLIFHPSKDSTCREFIRAREALETCLTPERYAIYPLGYDEVVQGAPWKENCTLVLVPPGGGSQDELSELAPKVVAELMSYLENGGALLSINESMNRRLGLKSLSDKTADVSITLDERAAVSPDSGVGGVTEAVTFHAISLKSCDSRVIQEPVSNPIDKLKLSREFIAFFESPTFSENTNQCNNVPNDSRSAVEVVSVSGGGCAVVCGVDLLPLPEGEIDVPLLVRLKKDVLLRSTVLSHLLGMLSMECSGERLPDLSHTYLVCAGDDEHWKFVSACAPLVQQGVVEGREVSLRLIEHNYQSGTPVDSAPCPTHSEMALITLPARWQLEAQPFNFSEYFDRLHTTSLGRTVLYTAVIPSTQTLFTGNIEFCNALTTDMGVVSVAGQQTRGKGRSGNVWLSPKGSMMFSTVLKLRPSSRLAQRLPLLQHLVAMAVVHGIRSSPGYEDLPIRIKWPNDIYYKDQVKLGGILVTSYALPDTCHHTTVIGCGVNVDNKYPTMSINDCITIHNATSGSALSPISVETCLAATLSSLESLLTSYESSGLNELEELYYKYWLHSGSVVRLGNYGDAEAVITGIDQYGYLLVRRREDGHELSLQPDGNSFDIMRGLIAMKTNS